MFKVFWKSIYTAAGLEFVFCSPETIHVSYNILGYRLVWPFPFVVVGVCVRFGLWPNRCVAVSVCGRFVSWPFRIMAVSVCGRYDLLPFSPKHNLSHLSYKNGGRHGKAYPLCLSIVIWRHKSGSTLAQVFLSDAINLLPEPI